jgi:hypothetical protein
MSVMDRPTVFISYSHRDEAWKDRLVDHLRVTLDDDMIEVWDDTRIPAGSDWEQDLLASIERADLALLLISADFLSSEYIRNGEVPRLLTREREQGIRILPVMLRPCAWRTVDWLVTRQLLPEGGAPLSALDENGVETALAAITERVNEILGMRAEAPTV